MRSPAPRSEIFRQIARVLPVDCAEESTLHDEGAGHGGVGIGEQIERRHERADRSIVLQKSRVASVRILDET
jgi:hypothetical protein